MRKSFLLAVTLLAATVGTAQAGPPYLSDDPEPTDFQHFEIYAFGAGSQSKDGLSGETGIDFNYGGAPDLQLTAALPLAYDEVGHTGLGNIELAAKYRFLHQEEDGLDLSVFPRIFLPSASHLGDNHAAFLLPLWAEKDFGKWSVFGGGGCTINRGDGSQDFCQSGVAVTREVAEGLRLGVEIFHQGADTIGGKVSTAVGGGLTYDLTANYHFLAYWGPGLQNTSATGRSNSYLALLFTF
jgi:hypothetical protein